MEMGRKEQMLFFSFSLCLLQLTKDENSVKKSRTKRSPQQTEGLTCETFSSRFVSLFQDSEVFNSMQKCCSLFFSVSIPLFWKCHRLQWKIKNNQLFWSALRRLLITFITKRELSTNNDLTFHTILSIVLYCMFPWSGKCGSLTNMY